MWVVTRATPDFHVDLACQSFATKSDAVHAAIDDAKDRACEDYSRGVADMMFEDTATDTDGLHAVWKNDTEFLVHRVSVAMTSGWFSTTRDVSRTFIARYKVHELYVRQRPDSPVVPPVRRHKTQLPNNGWGDVIEELKTRLAERRHMTP